MVLNNKKSNLKSEKNVFGYQSFIKRVGCIGLNSTDSGKRCGRMAFNQDLNSGQNVLIGEKGPFRHPLYRLHPNTLHLQVNKIKRYNSANHFLYTQPSSK